MERDSDDGVRRRREKSEKMVKAYVHVHVLFTSASTPYVRGGSFLDAWGKSEARISKSNVNLISSVLR